jgi:hypothetical protein
LVILIKSERPDGAVVVNALQEALGELLVAIKRMDLGIGYAFTG